MRLILTDTIDPEFDEKCEATADGSFRILIDENNKLEDYLNNPSIFLDIFKKEYDTFSELNFNKNTLIKNIINCEYVELQFDKTDVNSFIENNKFLSNKKIVLNGYYTIEDYEKVEELLKKYDKYLDKIYLSFEGNVGYTNIKDVHKTMQKIKEKAELIKSLNLSPMESIMFVYDMVRNRVYTKEGKNEDYRNSRNITSVLNGDKIVCLGYANIFKSMINYLGFKCENVIIQRKNNVMCHARNVIYVKDDKYDIDGVYYFDTTWDSKKKDNSFLNKYTYFAKSKREMDYLSKNYEMDFNYSDKLIKSFEEYLLEYMDKDEFEILDFVSKTRILYDDINQMSSIVNHTRLITNLCGIAISSKGDISKLKEYIPSAIEQAKELDNKFKYIIPAEVMISLVNNVRKIEYYINPELYQYDIETIRKIAVNSKWIFTRTYRTFHNLFYNNDDYIEMIKHYTNNDNLNKNINGVHFTKMLQKYAKTRK